MGKNVIVLVSGWIFFIFCKVNILFIEIILFFLLFILLKNGIISIFF